MRTVREFAIFALVFAAWFSVVVVPVRNIEDLSYVLAFLLTAILLRLTNGRN